MNTNNMLSMPRHEAEIGRQSYRTCFHAIRHPSELPSFFKTVYRDTKTYYSGQDLVDLEREELIENLAWTRKVAITTMGSTALTLFFLVIQLVLCRSELHDLRKST